MKVGAPAWDPHARSGLQRHLAPGCEQRWQRAAMQAVHKSSHEPQRQIQDALFRMRVLIFWIAQR